MSFVKSWAPTIGDAFDLTESASGLKFDLCHWQNWDARDLDTFALRQGQIEYMLAVLKAAEISKVLRADKARQQHFNTGHSSGFKLHERLSQQPFRASRTVAEFGPAAGSVQICIECF